MLSCRNKSSFTLRVNRLKKSTCGITNLLLGAPTLERAPTTRNWEVSTSGLSSTPGLSWRLEFSESADPDRSHRFLALRELGWEITPNFHCGFMRRRLHPYRRHW